MRATDVPAYEGAIPHENNKLLFFKNDRDYIGLYNFWGQRFNFSVRGRTVYAVPPPGSIYDARDKCSFKVSPTGPPKIVPCLLERSQEFHR